MGRLRRCPSGYGACCARMRTQAQILNSQAWWRAPIILALRRQGWMDAWSLLATQSSSLLSSRFSGRSSIQKIRWALSEFCFCCRDKMSWQKQIQGGKGLLGLRVPERTQAISAGKRHSSRSLNATLHWVPETEGDVGPFSLKVHPSDVLPPARLHPYRYKSASNVFQMQHTNYWWIRCLL